MATSASCEIQRLDNSYIKGYDGTTIIINGKSLDDRGSEVDDLSEVGCESVEG